MDRPPMENALSTDLVVDIVLKHLKVRDLLNCRQVSKCWNKAASSVLRSRSTMIKGILDEETLTELKECMEQSSDFPFAGLTLCMPWRLHSAAAMEFFHNYGDRFPRLCLNACLEARLEDQAPFIKHFSRLSTLELGDWARLYFQVLLNPAAGQEDGKVLKLSSVQTIRFMSAYSQVNEEVLRQVVTAASPSLRIECLRTSCVILKTLERVGKLQAVSVITLDQRSHDNHYALRENELFSTQTPALTKLDFNEGCISREGLMTLLISSQHTLEKLRLTGIRPSELSSECPVLSKLTKLSVRILSQTYEDVFQGSQGHKFPALKQLKLGITYNYNNSSSASLSDGLFIVPSLKMIELCGNFDKAGIQDLARSFPNVIEIRLEHNAYDLGWSECSQPTDIWSVGAFKFLEKLVIWHYTVQPPTKIFDNLEYCKDAMNLKKIKMMNMDSFLTGIPIGICENLRKQPQQSLKDSPFNEILRDSPNLLQLTNLKELIVDVRFKTNELKVLPDEPPFISMVSVWYALQMMPNLQWKFVYEDRWVKRHIAEEDRDKEVKMLKDAFKHVQPYVELEPFFYRSNQLWKQCCVP